MKMGGNERILADFFKIVFRTKLLTHPFFPSQEGTTLFFDANVFKNFKIQLTIKSPPRRACPELVSGRF